MDHLGDPEALPNGRIRLGVKECKSKLRAGIGQRDAQEVAREDATIEGLGELVDFEPNDEEDWPTCPGSTCCTTSATDPPSSG